MNLVDWLKRSSFIAQALIIIIIGVLAVVILSKTAKHPSNHLVSTTYTSTIPSDWKTYTNDQRNFSIKYPHTLIVNAVPILKEMVPEGVVTINFAKNQLTENFSPEEFHNQGFIINVWVSNDTSLEDQVKLDSQDKRDGFTSQKITVNNLSGYELTNIGLDYPTDVVILSKKGYLYTVSIKYLTDNATIKQEGWGIFHKMVSSLSFKP